MSSFSDQHQSVMEIVKTNICRVVSFFLKTDSMPITGFFSFLKFCLFLFWTKSKFTSIHRSHAATGDMPLENRRICLTNVSGPPVTSY